MKYESLRRINWCLRLILRVSDEVQVSPMNYEGLRPYIIDYIHYITIHNYKYIEVAII